MVILTYFTAKIKEADATFQNLEDYFRCSIVGYRPECDVYVTITLTMIIVFMNNKYLRMIVTCLYEMIRIAYVLNTWLVQCYTGSRERFRDDK